MTGNRLRVAALVTALLGVGIATYLTYVHCSGLLLSARDATAQDAPRRARPSVG